LAPYLAVSRELLGAAKASLWLGLSHPLISSSGLQPPSSPIGSSLSCLRRLLPTSLPYCHSTDLTCTIAHCSMLFPTVGWPTTSALAANLAYLYTLPLCTFFSSSYHNVVIQSTSLQHCDSLWYL
jgi:hypothetical protein